MSELQRIIPIADQRYLSSVPAIPAEPVMASGRLSDALGRPLRDLRISVTDRCNFRCSYCMPSEIFNKDYVYLPQSSLLSFEEITRLARLFIAHGVEKIRLTGGEPLLRKNIEVLIGMLARLKTASGRDLDLTLTTNGSLLANKARSLKDAGLQRVTVSLDGLDDAVFRQMNDVDFPVADVLKGIEAAEEMGLSPLKINMVVKNGTNDQEIVPMAQRFRGTSAVLRFIEFMDVGQTNGWRMDKVLPSAQLIERIHAVYPLEPVQNATPGETAQRWRYADGSGEIGVISSVTQAFCGDCNRARLSTEGKLFLCLFAHHGHDLRALLRAAHSDAQISTAIAQTWQQRRDRYSELRTLGSGPVSPSGSGPRVEMSYIGG